MSGEVSAELRRLTAVRANFCCEYCLLLQDFAAHRHEPDHIVPVQHGGASESGNLALACFSCNSTVGQLRTGERLRRLVCEPVRQESQF
jgi:5-methylcytosine-specific restriction endonuclease McrA